MQRDEDVKKEGESYSETVQIFGNNDKGTLVMSGVTVNAVELSFLYTGVHDEYGISHIGGMKFEVLF